MRPVLLLTRPAVQSARFAEEFATRFGADWPVIVSPLTELVFRDVELSLAPVRTVVFTSETGVAAFCRLTARRDFSAWTVGPRTAAAARAAGFATVVEGPGDAGALADAMAAERIGPGVLVARGVHQAVDVGKRLEKAGIVSDSVVLYEQAERDFTPEARRALAGTVPVLMPLFSVRAATLAGRKAGSPVAPRLVVAISPAVAKAAEPLAPAGVQVASRPDAEGMLTGIARCLGVLEADGPGH